MSRRMSVGHQKSPNICCSGLADLLFLQLFSQLPFELLGKSMLLAGSGKAASVSELNEIFLKPAFARIFAGILSVCLLLSVLITLSLIAQNRSVSNLVYSE